MSALDVEITIATRRGRRHQPDTPAPPRLPRVTRLMALAIKFQDMVDRGDVRDYADLARLGYVSRARITQIMNLLNLAPDIQVAILSGQASPAVPERAIRCLTSIVDWKEQRRLWVQTTGCKRPAFTRDSKKC